MIFVRSNSQSLKYQSFTAYSCEDIRIRKFEFAVTTQFLFIILNNVFKDRLKVSEIPGISRGEGSLKWLDV